MAKGAKIQIVLDADVVIHFAKISRPTADFLGQLLSYGSGIEVLEPQELRGKMRDLIAENLKRY